jgi:hypothetical protein
MMRTTLAGLALLLLSSQVAEAQLGTTGKAGDRRVRAALDEAGIEFTVDKDGDYKVIMPAEGTRTQLVFVISQTQEYGNMEIREVWSAAFKTGGRLDADRANAMLVDNDRKKLGAWRLYGTGANQLAVFGVHVAADADAETLRNIIKLVVTTADAAEKEQVGTDDL